MFTTTDLVRGQKNGISARAFMAQGFSSSIAGAPAAAVADQPRVVIVDRWNGTRFVEVTLEWNGTQYAERAA